MKRLTNKAVAQYRARARRKGLVRLEVQVPGQDAEAIRVVAALLREGERLVVEQTRRQLLALTREITGSDRLKELLAAAPLEGVTFERTRDTGRVVELP